MALLASVSIPGLLPPVPSGDRLLVDGGVLNPVPTARCADLGADVIIAVSLEGVPSEPVEEAEAVAVRAPPPTALSVLLPSIDVMQSRVSGEGTRATSIMITPKLSRLEGLRNFAAGRRFCRRWRGSS